MRGERVEPCLVAVVHASHHGEAAVLAAAHQRHHLHRLRLRLTSLARALSKLEVRSRPFPGRRLRRWLGASSVPRLHHSVRLAGCCDSSWERTGKGGGGGAARRGGAVMRRVLGREACADDPSCVLLNGLEVTVLGRVCFVRILLFPIT